jgi:hypothetical protein
MLAPLLATAAIAFQVALDVPSAPMLEHEAKSKKKPRKSAAARNTQAAAKAKTNAKPAPKGHHERNTRALAGLRKRWSGIPFEEEPINQSFRRRHESLLRSVVTQARALALDGEALPPMQIRPGCRTIRCDLELCGPEKIVAGIADLLPNVTLDGHPLWHELSEVEPTPDALERRPKGDPKDHLCRRWIVDFARDGGDISKLAIGEPAPEE